MGNIVPKPPGPKGIPFLGVALPLSKDTSGYLTLMAREYPDMAYLKVVGLPVYYISNPDYVKHVLQVNNKNYHKGIKYKFLKLFLGEGLLTSEGEFWLKQRRLAQPAFHKEQIASFAQTMTDYTKEMMKKWEEENRNETDMHTEMMALTLRIVGQTLLSKDLTISAREIGGSLSVLIANIYKRVHSIMDMPLWIPTLRNIRFKKASKVIDKVINDIIESRIVDQTNDKDLLSMLMAAKDEDTGETMTPAQLRDEVMTIFLAGHETTANALTWTIYLLSKHPEVEEKLLGELKTVLNGETPDINDVRGLKYTAQVIEESMRLYPPAWIIERHAMGDDEIGGYKISEGDEIMMCPFVMHRDPKYWKEPEKFDPDRFSEDRSKDRDRYCYFPFGGGPRYCIGTNFAMLEMQLVVATLYQQYKFVVKEGFNVEMEPLVTLRPKDGMPMTFERRE